ncbi:PREDICTED: uncharacterized protein LOC107192287 [Dufourea novaeangliae]|uniref:uncharacterized protein LOC107192287 n=1 Tax=Dufourea novaeangliae TaxID=178035 RepID=UPI000766F993|nr:PREDICTED: uncharacterized protein LOC107192287 [Dufourea novaeangliae]
MAERRFLNIERKLSRSFPLRQEYHEFMREYERLGHITKVPRDGRSVANPVYYLPHHAVMKETSTTTKVRVVSDGSAKTSTGVSLNEIQRVGPVVQDDLISILIRFRQFPVVLNADIAKMYRQIMITPEQRCLQRILWREEPTQPIVTYELNTVTYGTASAPFLATRVLRQVGLDNIDTYPIVSHIIMQDFYVDDLLTGTDTIEQAKIFKRDVSRLLREAGFELRKWASNEPTVVNSVSDEPKGIVSQADKDPRTLGMLWGPLADELRVAIKDRITTRVTKRVILSEFARIFDPLGLVGPVVMRAKLLIQLLWQSKVSWDESVPPMIHAEFRDFQSDLQSLRRVAIPRLVVRPNSTQVEIHGFCDASQKAYGACVYLRTVDGRGNGTARLLCGKSRVAPLNTISLPRLEHYGAFLNAISRQGANCFSDCYSSGVLLE